MLGYCLFLPIKQKQSEPLEKQNTPFSPFAKNSGLIKIIKSKKQKSQKQSKA